MIINIEANKAKFVELVKSIDVEGADIPSLVDYLEHSDFFTAPASTKYHSSQAGGLCEHSLIVYKTLIRLVNGFASHEEPNPEYKAEVDVSGNVLPSETPKTIRVRNFSDNSLKIVGLLHDISKTNFYEKFARNVKDETGNWVQVEEYRIRNNDNRFIYGTHEQNSEFIVRTFIPLTIEESVAILNHHAGMSRDSLSIVDTISPVFNKYSLPLFIHMADMLSAYYLEKEDE